MKGIKRAAGHTCTVILHKIYKYSKGSELSFIPTLLLSSGNTAALNGFVVNENPTTEGLKRENILD